MNHKTPFWEPVKEGIISVHQFEDVEKGETPCPNGKASHFNMMKVPGEFTEEQWKDDKSVRALMEKFRREHLTHCKCGHALKDTDRGGRGFSCKFKNVQTGEVAEREKLPAGAQFFATWMTEGWERNPGNNSWVGPDGQSLVVILPDGTDLMVDSMACNWTKPQEKTHKCWVRTGDPGDCNVTVGTDGNTWAAGAGSVQTSRWHGFLTDGELREC